jgi:cellulose synthase/poly-beta-1,6-N-acetylglucosamine synthase-like glycosyltransferase
MAEVHTLKALWAWLDARAGWLFLAGLGIAAAWNWWKWRQDRALALRLLAQKPGPVQLESTPKVSVLVAAWNEADIIREHVESFLRLRYPNKELILCAGGDDGTHEIACQYAAEQVVVLEQRPGEGKQRALQRCLRSALGEIIFLTDADCILNDDSFTAMLEPIVHEGEAVATGTCKPLAKQQQHSFVVYQWGIQLYGLAQTGVYSPGLQGANCAVLRIALETSGALDGVVSTGTDYHLARQLLHGGFRIRAVPGSSVETEYPERLEDYVGRQSRWVRNLILHGRAHGDHFHTCHALLTGMIGMAGLLLPLGGVLLGWTAWSVWLWLVAHSLMARLRYMGLAHSLGVTVPLATLVQLPVFLGADWLAAARALVEALIPNLRWQW